MPNLTANSSGVLAPSRRYLPGNCTWKPGSRTGRGKKRVRNRECRVRGWECKVQNEERGVQESNPSSGLQAPDTAVSLFTNRMIS